MHATWDTLLQTYVNSDGMVDYKGLKKESIPLHAYLNELAAHPPQKNWSKAKKLAYYINMYNAYTVALIIREYPIASIKDIENPWSTDFIQINDYYISLNTLEHDILRKEGEPRIHFAINCASISCPKLLNEAYTAGKLEAQLELVTKDFIQGSENSITPDHVSLSRIFKWYQKDFEVDGKANLIAFLNAYSKEPIKADAKITYKEYNWNLNEQ